jgi:hypothetical protein
MSIGFVIHILAFFRLSVAVEFERRIVPRNRGVVETRSAVKTINQRMRA